MQDVEAGMNQIVTVTIEYTDGTSEQVAMTKKKAIELQNQVAAHRKPTIRRVSW